MLNPESTDFCIELLAPHHDQAAFSCGNEQLDRYLHSTATQDRKRNIAIDDEAVRFYQRFDFQAFPDRAFKLFRTMKSIEQSFDRYSS